MTGILSAEEMIRYDRQIKALGVEAQSKLKKASILIVGLGGLGSVSSIYLTAMGVGRLIVVDREKVELSNLNRQILYSTNNIGEYKAIVAKRRLKALNPKIDIEGIVTEINRENVDKLVKDVDLVLDGLDNWKTRLVINEACVRYGVPFIHAGVRGFYGQLMVIIPGEGPCLRCIMAKTPLEEEQGVPVIGVIPATIASLQVIEALKIITGKGSPSVGYLMYFDGRKLELRKLRVYRNPKCPVCGSKRQGI